MLLIYCAKSDDKESNLNVTRSSANRCPQLLCVIVSIQENANPWRTREEGACRRGRLTTRVRPPFSRLTTRDRVSTTLATPRTPTRRHADRRRAEALEELGFKQGGHVGRTPNDEWKPLCVRHHCACRLRLRACAAAGRGAEEMVPGRAREKRDGARGGGGGGGGGADIGRDGRDCEMPERGNAREERTRATTRALRRATAERACRRRCALRSSSSASRPGARTVTRHTRPLVLVP